MKILVASHFPNADLSRLERAGLLKHRVRLLDARAYRDYFSLLLTKISKCCVIGSAFLVKFYIIVKVAYGFNIEFNFKWAVRKSSTIWEAERARSIQISPSVWAQVRDIQPQVMFAIVCGTRTAVRLWTSKTRTLAALTMSHCITMTTHIESVCCREITAVQHRPSLLDGPRRLRSHVHQQGSVRVKSRPDVDVRFVCRLVGSTNS